MSVLVGATILLVGLFSFADTSVSEVTVDRIPEWEPSEPDYHQALDTTTRLTLHAKTEQGNRIGRAYLDCGDDAGTTPRISFEVFGTRPDEPQDIFSLNTVRIEVDQGTSRDIQADVDRQGLDFEPPHTAVSLPHPYESAWTLVDELAEGSWMLVEVDKVPPTLRFDLATARPDVAVFQSTCDQIRDDFEQSPARWAVTDTEVHSATGIIELWLYHDANNPSIPEDVFVSPHIMVTCQKDRRGNRVDVYALVPEHHQVKSVRGGETIAISIQVDASPPRQITLTAMDGDEAGVAWTTTELAQEERPPTALLEELRTGSIMTLSGLGAQPLRFNLAGGRPAIAEFADACGTVAEFVPADPRAK